MSDTSVVAAPINDPKAFPSESNEVLGNGIPPKLKILVIDIGGTNVKVLATGHKERRRFPSGPKMTPQRMVAGIRKLVAAWEYDVVAIGYPGCVFRNQPVTEPHILAKGWTRFNFRAAFKRPVRIVN